MNQSPLTGPQSPFEQERRDECRQDVLGFLAARQALAHHPQTICRGLNAGHRHDYAVAEVLAALSFRLSAGHVQVVHPEGGSTKYYQATAAGVLAHERGEPTV
jgi:hypothetical protein